MSTKSLFSFKLIIIPDVVPSLLIISSLNIGLSVNSFSTVKRFKFFDSRVIWVSTKSVRDWLSDFKIGASSIDWILSTTINLDTSLVKFFIRSRFYLDKILLGLVMVINNNSFVE